MRDYSGGERSQSSYGADAVKAIQEGRTQSQVDRNLREKIMMGGIQAALMGARGMAGAKASDDLKKTQAQGDLRKSAEQYAPATAHHDVRSDGAPEWLGQAGEGNSDALQAQGPSDGPDWMRQPKSMQQRAEEALANGQQNDSANDAPLGGYYTTDGSQKAMQDSSALTNDMKTAEDGMRGGGMMGSLQRKGLY